MNWLRRYPSGRVVVDDSIVLNPQIESSRQSAIVRRPADEQPTSPFKLVTVRRMLNMSVGQINQAIAFYQAELQGLNPGIQLAPSATEANKRSFFAVYVDEDLGNSSPVYAFYSPSSTIKAFITANGATADDWSVHIAHETGRTSLPSGATRNEWRLFSIHNNLNGDSSKHLLESTALSDSYTINMSIQNINYLGGGTWCIVAINDEHKIPIYGFISQIQYPQYQVLNPSTGRAIISYSVTPSESLTWCKGVTTINSVERQYSFEEDTDFQEASGVRKWKLESNYRLNYSLSPTAAISEYSFSSAEWLGSTNVSVNSPFQSPDYGTDRRRASLSTYNQTSNVVRARKPQQLQVESFPDKHSYQPSTFIPILCSSNDASVWLKYRFTEGRGSINHPFEVKRIIGRRGITHLWYYPYWWAYGRVISTRHINEDGRPTYYRINRLTGQPNDASRREYPAPQLDASVPNRIELPWESFLPQSGFFSPWEGEAVFELRFENPPLTGHDSIYYYHINPVNLSGTFTGESAYSESNFASVGAAGFSLGGSFTTGATGVEQANQRLMNYSMMLGGLGGSAVPSLNIGNVNYGSNFTSFLVFSPPPYIEAEYKDTPYLFPFKLLDPL